MSEGRVVAEKDKSLGRVIFDNIKKHNNTNLFLHQQLKKIILRWGAPDSADRSVSARRY